jgi:hypothetical protein
MSSSRHPRSETTPARPVREARRRRVLTPDEAGYPGWPRFPAGLFGRAGLARRPRFAAA